MNMKRHLNSSDVIDKQILVFIYFTFDVETFLSYLVHLLIMFDFFQFFPELRLVSFKTNESFSPVLSFSYF